MGLFVIPPEKVPYSLEKIELRQNPERLANLERCRDLARELMGEEGISIRARSVQGGMQFSLRLSLLTFFKETNRLLGELIARSNQFWVRPDPEDPDYTCLDVIVFSQDLFWNGKPVFK